MLSENINLSGAKNSCSLHHSIESENTITGTSSGLGRDISEILLKKEFKVIGISRKNKVIKNKNYFHYSLDLTKTKELEKTLLLIYKKFKRIDCLINNAAAKNPYHFFPFLKNEEFQKVINLNIYSNLYLTKFFSNIMVRQGDGYIINISSIASDLLLKGDSIYASSKCFVETFSKILAKEIGPFGVSCDVIKISLYKGNLSKNISIKNLNKIKKISNKNDFVGVGDVVDIIENKIFKKKNKKICKIFKL